MVQHHPLDTRLHQTKNSHAHVSTPHDSVIAVTPPVLQEIMQFGNALVTREQVTLLTSSLNTTPKHWGSSLHPEHKAAFQSSGTHPVYAKHANFEGWVTCHSVHHTFDSARQAFYTLALSGAPVVSAAVLEDGTCEAVFAWYGGSKPQHMRVHTDENNVEMFTLVPQ